MKVKIGISNRHIHLTKEDADLLFGENYQFTKRNDLTQKGEYACEEVVKVYTDKYMFDHVRVLGPLRNYTQVEVSKDDAELLGINPPMRDSGDLANSESVNIEGPKGKMYKKNCCILATRHLHCHNAADLGHNKNDILTGTINGQEMTNIHIKENENFTTELHIDKTDAKLFNVENGDYIDIE